ncbi:MAG: glycosyltransferase family 39 protein [Actinobacteria bacterium]|nr:glycosyltransferase family 39 protein [Actinomycetota bacterium]MBV8561654.1 glycosyltransferase family 39 protein [Actinomycetota bacterium]
MTIELERETAAELRAAAPVVHVPEIAAPLDRVRPWLWLVGWWALGRVVTIATAMAVKPSIWTLSLWDGKWYRMVARFGYLLVPSRQSDPAFFPLYPIVLRGANTIGIPYEFAGPLISNLALVGTLAVFYLLTRDLKGEDFARRATIYVAIFPFGYVFSMTYPESLVLGLIAGSALAARRGRWWVAGLLAAAAALARPEGLFVALPLLGIAWGRRRSLDPQARGAALGAILAPAAALLAYPAYLKNVIHDPHAWQQAQQGWGRHFHALGIVKAIEHLPNAIAYDHWLVRDVVAVVLYLALLAVAARAGLPRMWILAGVVVVILPPFSGAFDSISRFGLLVPAVFWGLAVLGRDKRVDWGIRVLSVGLLIGAVATLPYVFP